MTIYGLCIGINDYPGTGMDLSGCVNDANDWAAALTRRGARVETLLDSAATGRNMREGIAATLLRAKRGDSVIVTYSGHGTRVPDTSGDEPDRYDEALCPHDLMTNGVITDDELHDLFSDRAPGVRAVLISDSCHSGTVSRLASSLAGAGVVRRPRFMPPAVFLEGDALERVKATPKLFGLSVAPRHPNLLMAGCMDHQFSYDAWFNGRPNGAFTYAALAALEVLTRNGLRPTYRDWYDEIAARLPSVDFPDQAPQLYGTTSQKRWPALG